MSIDQFIAQYCGLTESYWFYNNSIELVYDPKAHLYYRVEGSDLIPLDGVTTVCHIVDKSEILIPWGCKMAALKLLSTTPTITLPTGDKIVPQMTYAEYEKLVTEAKSAHKEKLEDAGEVGHKAHDWIERYIKAQIAGQDFSAPFPADERAANGCRAALDWMRRHNVVWICTEKKIYSHQYQYAGTMDGLCRLDSCDDPTCCPSPFKSQLAVADWKTSNALHIEYLLQTAAYMKAHNEQELFEKGEGAELVLDRWIIRLGKDDGEFETWHAPAETYQDDLTAFVDALTLRRSYAVVKNRMKDREEQLRQIAKAKRQLAKEAQLKVKCAYADKYKASRKPNCNGGNPCLVCIAKYREKHPNWVPDNVPPELTATVQE